jgi:hypothetical protein
MSAVRHQRARSPQYEGVRDYRQTQGRVEVNENGYVTTASRGKNKWHSDFKKQCLRMLDPSIDVFMRQDQRHWGSVCQMMRDTWEYVDKDGKPAPIAQGCLDLLGGRILKQERSSLKQTFIQSEGFKGKKVPTPLGLTDMQWDRLVREWTSESGLKKVKQ